MACASPAAACLAETASTLKFAARAKQVKNRVMVNESASQSAVEMQAELQRLRAEVAMLRAAGSAGGCGGGDDVQRQALAVNAQLEERVGHLQEQLGRLRQ